MRFITYLKSRTVWMGLIGFLLSAAAAFQIDSIAGLPVGQIASNKEVLASQLTVIAAGACDLLAILFRIKSKAVFKTP